MGNTVSFQIKISDSGSISTLTVDTEELAKVINAVRESANRLNADFVNFAAASQIIEGVSSAVGQLQGMFSQLTAAYSVQVAAETRLEQAMRNTMGATAEEIQSVKDLCSAQQQIGIVGDEVQLAAAQELATYLEYSDNLKMLIPVMNDMVAQQLSLGASGESAAQIASMLGKVMNGQTEALSRYGYKFDEAQKYILQFGDESQRAAVLADVVSEAVGGMNAAMGATDAGRMQSVANTIGDIKEQLGGAVQAAAPYVSVLSEMTLAASGVMRLVQAFKALHLQNLLVKASSAAAAFAQRTQALAAKILGVNQLTAAAATGTLRVQIVALQAAMTMGLAYAVTKLITLIGRLTDKTNEAADAVEKVDDAKQAYGEASHQAMLEVAGEIVELEKLIKSKGAEGKKVAELNSAYGDVFGSHATAAEWYDVLRSKSADYCRQLGYEAKAKVLAAKSGEKQVALDDLRKQISAMEESGPQARTITRTWNSYGSAKVNTRTETTDYGRLKDQEEALAKEVAEVTAQFEECVDAARTAADAVGVSAGDSTTAVSAESSAMGTLADDIEQYRKSVEGAVQVSRVFATSETEADVRLSAMKRGISALILKYGAENESVKALITEYEKLNGVRPKLTRASALPGSGAEVQNPSGEMEEAVRKWRELQEELAAGRGGKMKGAVDTIDTLSAAMRGLSGAVGEAAGAWLEWGANLLQAIAAALPQLSKLFAANTANTGMEAAESVANVPYVGPVLAVAAIASILAAAASLPKFAAGGIAYGPTVGLFGEYAGASTNPEVVAPLDKLRGLLGTDTAGGSGKVRFEIEGRKLVGILAKENNVRSRR